MPLHHSAVIETLVLDNVPVAVRLSVLLSLGASQKHGVTNYAHHHALGNRVGLHYSRFRPISDTSPLADQRLSSPKNRKIAIFKRESANSG
jgi:hypothetical protein